MKIFNISNPVAFFKRIQRCKGNVYSVDETGHQQDMKELAAILNQSGMMKHIGAITEIDIVMESLDDVHTMLGFVYELCRNAA